MPTLTTPTSALAWLDEIRTTAPTDAVPDALILQTSLVSGTVEGDAAMVRVAYVDDDDAAFVPEGEAIAEADPDLAEATVVTGKIAKLIRVSREQFYSSDAARLLADSVSRAVSQAANRAYVAQPAPTAPALTPPAGLIHVPGILGSTTPILVDGNLDALIDLEALIGENNGTVTHLVVSPSAWSRLRKIKDQEGAARNLLGAGTDDAARFLLGIPVVVSSAVPAGTGLMLDKQAIVSAVGPVMVAQSSDAYFQYDAIGLRCTWRFGAVVVRPERVGVFSVTDPTT